MKIATKNPVFPFPDLVEVVAGNGEPVKKRMLDPLFFLKTILEQGTGFS